MNSMTRRERQITDENEIREILDSAKVVHVGLVDGDEPYVVPMNYGYTFESGKLTHHRLSVDEREFRLMPQSAKNTVNVTEMADEKVNGHHAILENFASAVLNGTPLLASGFDAINELELSNGAYLSAWQDRKITLPVSDEDFLKLLEQRKNISSVRDFEAKEEITDSYFSRWNTNW